MKVELSGNRETPIDVSPAMKPGPHLLLGIAAVTLLAACGAGTGAETTKARGAHPQSVSRRLPRSLILVTTLSATAARRSSGI